MNALCNWVILLQASSVRVLEQASGDATPGPTRSNDLVVQNFDLIV